MERPVHAVIFDMDGVLVESESLWRRAEQDASDRLGLGLREADFEGTMGVRMREVAQIWYERSPWEGPSVDEVANSVVDQVVELVKGAEALPGVHETIALARANGLCIGLCTSSDTVLMNAVLDSLDLNDAFDATHSAENDEFGKPHPMPYLKAAAKLGVDPGACVAIEDTVSGAVSAKAAHMRVVAVPDPANSGDGRFGFVDLSLESLTQFDGAALQALRQGRRTPSVSRPRFHRAFPVDELADARWFYGEVLGCREGRSADSWIDFDLYGHQVVAHLAPAPVPAATNVVDGHDVPAEHWGLLLHPAAWRDLVARLEAQGDRIRWIMKPTTRFAGAVGEQHTCFVLDPAGNALEFKAFANDDDVFAR
ncbi:MAG: hexitol phosphatase HxpB [Acidimicrobiales bacterium]|nr:hexitol phosphatase HxpB [Acidimicrobiales bacterium]